MLADMGGKGLGKHHRLANPDRQAKPRVLGILQRTDEGQGPRSER